MKLSFFSKPKPRRPNPSFLLDLHASGTMSVFRRRTYFRLFDPSPLDPQPLLRPPTPQT
jgi:hypothetical protein